MKTTLFIIVILITLAGLPVTGNAQTTYTVTTNPEAWATLVSGGNCNNCIINIPTGFTLNIGSTGSCTNCTFNGGTVNVASGFTFNAGNLFENGITLINVSLSVKSMNFLNDSVAFNKSISYSASGTQIVNSRVSFNAVVAFQTAEMTGDSLHLNSSISYSGSPDSITDSHVDVANGATLGFQGGVVTNSVISLNGNAKMTSSNPFTSSGSSYYLDNTSSVKLSSTATFKGNDNISLSDTSTFTASSTISMTDGSITTSDHSTLNTSSTFTATNSTLSFGDNSVYTPSSPVNITGGSLTMSEDATMNASSTVTIKNASVIMNDSSKLAGKSTISFTGSSVQMNNNSSLSSSSTIDLASTVFNLNGDASLSTKSTISVTSGSDLTIGDGSSTSGANVVASNLNVSGGSLVGIAGGDNFLQAGNTSGIPGFSIGNNTLSCNKGAVTGFPNACSSNTVFGCATLNSGGGVACVTLAIANLDLTAALNGPGTVALSWTDDDFASAASFQVQRSAGNSAWTTLATVPAGGSVSNTFHFEDNSAPAGTVDYRIVHVDKDGKESYSAISSVNVTIASTGKISVYPNPATGHAFNISTPSTDEFTLNLYTITGQLISRSSLQGQTQYPVRLPAQIPAGSVIVIQAIGRTGSQSFTMLLQ